MCKAKFIFVSNGIDNLAALLEQALDNLKSDIQTSKNLLKEQKLRLAEYKALPFFKRFRKENFFYSSISCIEEESIEISLRYKKNLVEELESLIFGIKAGAAEVRLDSSLFERINYWASVN